MATSPIYNWPEPDNTDLVKNGALAIRTLGNAIDTTMATMVPKTIVDAKGDLIAGTAADTAARLAVGNNGETLVADASTSTGLRYQAPVNFNPVLNSAMQVWQRGTSVTGGAGGAYAADRWFLYAGGQATMSRQAVGDTTNLPFIQYCARVQRANSSSDTTPFSVSQSFETVNSIPFAGKTVTFSFYARRGANYSPTSNKVNVYLATGTGTDQRQQGGSYTGQQVPINSFATLTTTWQRFTFTGTIDATATEITPILEFVPTGTAGAADFFEVTGVQLEVGSVATPFKTYAGTIQGELAACQRYYERVNWDAATGYATFGQGAAQTTTNARTIIPFLVQKRVRPTAIDYPTVSTSFRVLDFADNVTGAPSAVAFDSNQTSTAAGYLNWTTSGATVNRPYLVTGNNTTGAYLGWSAEL